jgi:16S rRNA (cytosine967-C5)-methyltransferase
LAMTKDRPRELALKALVRTESVPDFSENYLDRLLINKKYLDERDRAFISNLVQGVVRWRSRLDLIIESYAVQPLEKTDPVILNILRLALYQIFFLDRVPDSAAVNSAVNQAKKEKGRGRVVSFVNGILRKICRNKESINYPDREKDLTGFLSRFWSYPEWMVNKWLNTLGEDFTEDLLSAQNNFPDLNIRVNSLKINRERLINYLADQGVEAEPLEYSPEGIRLKDFRGRIERLKPFKKGMFQVQDQAAQVVSHLLSPCPGDNIVDICAGYGGKSSHLQELMENRGKVLALDRSLKRVKNNQNNCGRLGVLNISPVVADAGEHLSWLFKGRFNKALIDAPCMGLGVISRHPDIKWNKKEEDFKRISSLQKKIMEMSFSAVQTGGIVLYAVCSISREENEEVVEYLLEGNRDISLVNMKKTVPPWGIDLIDSEGFFRSYPNVHNMDGFFAALFKKN